MTTRSYVDEWLAIMSKLGFIHSSLKSHAEPTLKDEYRTAKIFSSWIGEVHTSKAACENGIMVGYVIIIRAKYKGLKLRDVAVCLKQTSDFYLELAEENDKMLKQDSKAQALGREENGNLRKEEKVIEMQATRLILCVLVTAMEQVVDAAAAEHKASAAKK